MIPPEKVKAREIITNIKSDSQLNNVGIDLTSSEMLVIKSGESVRFTFIEKFNTRNTYGIIHIRNHWAKRGLSLSSGVVKPYYYGFVGCTLINNNKNEIILEKGVSIANIIMYEFPNPDRKKKTTIEDRFVKEDFYREDFYRDEFSYTNR